MGARSLFGEHDEPVPVLDALAAGIAAGEACQANAERQGWDSEAASQFVLDYLRQHGPTSGETLVTATSEVHRPHDGRAFGPVFARLKRKGLIETCGTIRRTKGHGTHGGLVWRLIPGGPEQKGGE